MPSQTTASACQTVILIYLYHTTRVLLDRTVGFNSMEVPQKQWAAASPYRHGDGPDTWLGMMSCQGQVHGDEMALEEDMVFLQRSAHLGPPMLFPISGCLGMSLELVLSRSCVLLASHPESQKPHRRPLGSGGGGACAVDQARQQVALSQDGQAVI